MDVGGSTAGSVGQPDGPTVRGRVVIQESSPARLAIKYRNHVFSETRSRGMVYSGLFLFAMGLITIVSGIVILIAGLLLASGIIMFTLFYLSQSARKIVVDKDPPQFSFSDTGLFSPRIPLGFPLEHVKCLTIASPAPGCKPEHMLSVTLHPVPQGPFTIGHFTHVLVKSVDLAEIDHLARLISEFAGIPVTRQT